MAAEVITPIYILYFTVMSRYRRASNIDFSGCFYIDSLPLPACLILSEHLVHDNYRMSGVLFLLYYLCLKYSLLIPLLSKYSCLLCHFLSDLRRGRLVDLSAPRSHNRVSHLWPSHLNHHRHHYFLSSHAYYYLFISVLSSKSWEWELDIAHRLHRHLKNWSILVFGAIKKSGKKRPDIMLPQKELLKRSKEGIQM